MKSKRIVYLDLIRVIACIMVVFMHAPMPTVSNNGIILVTISYLTAPCIGLFFMVSGALLLPLKADTFKFLKTRFSKIIIPTIIWSLFYIAINGGFSRISSQLIQSIFSIPFSPIGNGVLWFMYVIAGLYLVAPVISPWIEKAKKSEIELYLTLWAITLCFPLFDKFLMITEGVNSLFYYLSGYIGYFILGYYLNIYCSDKIFKYLIPAVILAIAAPVICVLIDLKPDFYHVFWYLSIFVATMAIFWFSICRQYINKFRVNIPTIELLSNISFGIYLIHIFIMRNLLWHWDWFTEISYYPLQCLLSFAFTFVISTVICCLIACLPFGEYIIGFKFRKKS